MRRLHVYTPPGYSSASGPYPVLYLLHGSGDSDSDWTMIGRAGIIADNLAAGGKTTPMLIVMPDGHAVKDRDPALRKQNNARFEEDLIQDIVPLIGKSYHASGNQKDRALAGLSMGGAQTLSIGLGHLDLFSYLGVFSAGASAGTTIPESAKDKLRLFWIGCARKDTGAYQGSLRLVEALKNAGVRYSFRESEGTHNWRVWRPYLAEFLPLLFPR
jgi:enterochelin esterase family protein